MLWIAFKFVSLYRMTQHNFVAKGQQSVVNCFQICIFVSDDTAKYCSVVIINQLWIAFKFVSLYRMTQRCRTGGHRWRGCELLSNLYLCIGWHSWITIIKTIDYVVNCFQICIFVSDDTACLRFLVQGCGCELLSNLYLCIGWHSSMVANYY